MCDAKSRECWLSPHRDGKTGLILRQQQGEQTSAGKNAAARSFNVQHDQDTAAAAISSLTLTVGTVCSEVHL